MKFGLFTDYGAKNSKPVFDAFAAGAERLGHTVVLNNTECDIPVIWSVLWHGKMAPNQTIWNAYRSVNKPVVVLEVGQFFRGTTWKVGLNGVNGDAYFSPKGNDEERIKKFGLSLSSWSQGGDYILICSQHEKSQQWINQPKMSAWVMKNIEEIQSISSLPIVLRPHPRSPLPHIERQYKNVYRQDPVQLDDTYDDFDLTFKNAHAVINWNSNPGVQAIIAGIPAFTGPSSLASIVANLDLKNILDPIKPDRSQWFNDIAHTEHTLEEIAAGIPLKYLTDYIKTANFN